MDIFYDFLKWYRKQLSTKLMEDHFNYINLTFIELIVLLLYYSQSQTCSIACKRGLLAIFVCKNLDVEIYQVAQQPIEDGGKPYYCTYI